MAHNNEQISEKILSEYARNNSISKVQLHEMLKNKELITSKVQEMDNSTKEEILKNASAEVVDEIKNIINSLK